MKSLRLFVALWLSVSVPTTALAAVIQGHCNMKQMATAMADEHAGHQMQGMDHSQHMMHMAATGTNKDNPPSGCKCGCNCSQHHCVSGGSGFLAMTAVSIPVFGDSEQRSYKAVPDTASAHHLDLLRPPSLT